MEGEKDRFELKDMIELSQLVADSIGGIDIDILCEYLHWYVLMLKTMGKLIEIGFNEINSKWNLLKTNRDKFNAKGENIQTLEELLELEINLGLGKVNGSNNK